MGSFKSTDYVFLSYSFDEDTGNYALFNKVQKSGVSSIFYSYIEWYNGGVNNSKEEGTK